MTDLIAIFRLRLAECLTADSIDRVQSETWAQIPFTDGRLNGFVLSECNRRREWLKAQRTGTEQMNSS